MQRPNRIQWTEVERSATIRWLWWSTIKIAKSIWINKGKRSWSKKAEPPGGGSVTRFSTRYTNLLRICTKSGHSPRRWIITGNYIGIFLNLVVICACTGVLIRMVKLRNPPREQWFHPLFVLRGLHASSSILPRIRRPPWAFNPPATRPSSPSQSVRISSTHTKRIYYKANTVRSPLQNCLQGRKIDNYRSNVIRVQRRPILR